MIKAFYMIMVLFITVISHTKPNIVGASLFRVGMTRVASERESVASERQCRLRSSAPALHSPRNPIGKPSLWASRGMPFLPKVCS